MTSAQPTTSDVIAFLRQHGISESVTEQFEKHAIDGLSMCLLTEQDLRDLHVPTIRERKHLIFLSACWRRRVEKQHSLGRSNPSFLQTLSDSTDHESPTRVSTSFLNDRDEICSHACGDSASFFAALNDSDHLHLVEPNPRFWKVLISILYTVIVTGITSFVMVIAHERLPDISKYPPLPDLLLDNLPYISWAFTAAELVCLVLTLIWVSIILIHRHRLILIRRFFAITGTVFLLRSITMLITSLSVPGHHLSDQCAPYVFKTHLDRFKRVWDIWSGMGMSIRGIQTCGDYMFSGHTTMLTLLNFFITEYSPRCMQSVHTFSWVLNLFGVFFILASHEHYSIDVFVACYVSSRLFLYYHCLANGRILHQGDKKRAMIWFPLFTFFEYDVQGIVPNTYGMPSLKNCSLTKLKELVNEANEVICSKVPGNVFTGEPNINGSTPGLIKSHEKKS